MTMKSFSSHKRKAAAVLAATLISASFAAHGSERADMEQLRATTLNLIEALVDSGVLSRQKADQLVRDAEAKARAQVALVPAPAPAAEVGKDGKKVVRVTYVPESVKQEIRQQVKQDVLAQSKTERWGEPGALPEWLDRFQFEGDMRMRYESTRLDENNTPPGVAYTDGLYTRAADLVGNSLVGGIPSANTQHDRSRWRLRARLGVNAKVSDMVSAGLRISTGNTSDRTSTNQTLGQNFNKYSLVLDRAFLKLDPTSWLSISGGRIANPYFNTDLVWAEDLNFEGVAISAKPRLSSAATGFFTAGWYPLRESNPGRTTSRDLLGVQGGVDWAMSSKTQLKLGAALYDYRNIEGQAETVDRFLNASDYVTRYEYGEGFRQRGNTLFIVNSLLDPNVNWGLASKFRELNLTGMLDLGHFSPMHVILTGDYVKNLAFDRDEIAARTGFRVLDGKDYGYMAKVQFGHPKTDARNKWNVGLAYRYLGSDAVLDAFTNSDFGLGGTNNKGFILDMNYGIDKNAWIRARWMSSDLIDPMVPQTPMTNPTTKLSVDLLQIDLNAKF